jgi:hypothetical protein
MPSYLPLSMWKISGTLQTPSVGLEGKGGGLRHETRAYDAATAVLEIVARKLPLHLVCHRSLRWPKKPGRFLANELRLVDAGSNQHYHISTQPKTGRMAFRLDNVPAVTPPMH